jgi:hypothetical protein
MLEAHKGDHDIITSHQDGHRRWCLKEIGS